MSITNISLLVVINGQVARAGLIQALLSTSGINVPMRPAITITSISAIDTVVSTSISNQNIRYELTKSIAASVIPLMRLRSTSLINLDLTAPLRLPFASHCTTSADA